MKYDWVFLPRQPDAALLLTRDSFKSTPGDIDWD
jgi:hypothetical protein